MQNSVSSIIIYRKYYHLMIKAMNLGKCDIEECNLILVGIAKDLGIMNPILL